MRGPFWIHSPPGPHGSLWSGAWQAFQSFPSFIPVSLSSRPMGPPSLSPKHWVPSQLRAFPRAVLLPEALSLHCLGDSFFPHSGYWLISSVSLSPASQPKLFPHQLPINHPDLLSPVTIWYFLVYLFASLFIVLLLSLGINPCDIICLICHCISIAYIRAQ